MSKFKITSFLILIIFFLNNCGFTPQYAGFKNLDFNIIVKNSSGDRDLNNDAVYLIDISPESPEFGQAIDLDIGYYADLPESRKLDNEHQGSKSGRFPTLLDERENYFPYDSKKSAHTLFVESILEKDQNQNNRLDDAEDIDGDLVLDRPNTIDGKAIEQGSFEAVDKTITFYEFNK